MPIKERIRPIVRRVFNRETLAYLICGVITTIISYACYIALALAHASVFWANTASTVVGVLIAFVANKFFVFESKDTALKPLAKEFISFVAGRVLTYALETCLLMLLVDWLGFDYFIPKAFTMTLVVVSNYFISKFAVFHKKNKKVEIK